MSTGSTVDNMGSCDPSYTKDKIEKKAGDPNKRAFTYFVLGGARFIYASAARLIALKVHMDLPISAPRDPCTILEARRGVGIRVFFC